jgi:polyhydroxyalkanoate synthesis regulator phasin
LQANEFYLFVQIFLGVSAAIVVVGGFVRWADNKLESRIVKEIKEATQQIQPNANGGQSLRDLHNKLDSLMRDVSLLKTSVLRLEGEIRTLEEDVEDLR